MIIFFFFCQTNNKWKLIAGWLEELKNIICRSLFELIITRHVVVS